MSRGDTMKRVEICSCADDVYVRELRLTRQKLSQSAKGFCEAPVEAASPRQGRACSRYDRDLLIPEVEVDHSVTGATERSVGKQHVTGQSAELGPKNAVRPLAVLEHALPPSQPTIERKNELCPKRSRVAVCSRSILSGMHGTYGSNTAALEHSALLGERLLLTSVSSTRPSLEWVSHRRCRGTHRPRVRGRSLEDDPSAIL